MTTIILTTDQVKARLFELLAGQTTPKFIAVKNYRNEEGEVSNYVINIGADFQTAKDKDAETLKDANILNDIDFGIVKSYSEEARVALLTALINPTQETVNRSEGQINAYTNICANVRMHNDTGRIMVWGMKVSKIVLVKGVYKTVKSRPLTIAKNMIRETLKATKFRQYCLDKIVEIRMNGETLEFDLD